MFPKLKTHPSGRFYRPCLESVEQVDESFITCYKDDVEILPPCSDFDLKKLIQANVPLEQMSSKIKDSASVVLPNEEKDDESKIEEKKE